MSKPGIVIPAYQPDKKLLTLIQALRQQRPDQTIIVVNDGSDQRCGIIFDELSNIHRVTVLHHPHNQGKGQALKTAFKYYLQESGHAATGIVTADADGQHSVEDILILSDALERYKQQFHLGIRNFNSAEIPWRSKAGNSLTSFIFRKLCRAELYDTQTGLRGIPVNLLKSALASQARGYELEMEMLLSAARQKVPIHQIQIKTIYFDHNAASHFNPWLDSFKIYRVVFRFLLSSKRIRQTGA